MKDQLVSFNTAKLAKEKGFNISCFWAYKEGRLATTFLINDDNYHKLSEFYAPTQSLLQKWLRETTDVEVLISSHGEKEQSYTKVKRVYTATVNNWAEVKIHVLEGGDGELIRTAHPDHWHFEESTYEKALEKGLQEALKLI